MNGPAAAPLYTYLKQQKGFGGFDLSDAMGQRMDQMFRQRDANYADSPDIKWNFTKFLVSRDGRVVKRFEPTDPMTAVEADVQAELNHVVSAVMHGAADVHQANQGGLHHD